MEGWYADGRPLRHAPVVAAVVYAAERRTPLPENEGPVAGSLLRSKQSGWRLRWLMKQRRELGIDDTSNHKFIDP